MRSRLLLSGRFKSGVPLGGLGTGKIEILPTGRLNRLTIQNNWSFPLVNNPKLGHDRDGGLLGFHFALWVKKGSHRSLRLLESMDKTAAVSRIPDWKGVDHLSYQGAFPKAVLTYHDKALSLDIQLTAYSPVIPHDYNASMMPGCVFSFEIRNRLSSTAEVSLLMVGRNISGAYAVGRTNRIENKNGTIAIHFENKGSEAYEPETGSLTIGLKEKPGHEISFLTQWNLHKEHFRLDRLINLVPLSTWKETGRLPNLSPQQAVRGGSVNWGGALADSFHLPGHERATTTFVVTWYYPNAPEGHIYSKRFSHSSGVNRWLVKKKGGLEKRVDQWHSIIEEASLPEWLTAALPNSLSPLVSASRWGSNGEFWLYEAPVICPYLGTLDVRFYGSLPLALLFPRLEKRELLEFAKAQRPDGYIPHDLGWMKPGGSGDGTTPFLWKDLCPKFALLAYRDILWMRDLKLLREIYPSVKRALKWALESDTDGDGLPDNEGTDQTFDLWDLKGASSYVSGIHLAALLAGQRLATMSKDEKARNLYQNAFERAQKSFIDKLWNGEYFMTWKQGNASSHSSSAAQLAGQWYADLLGLGPIVPPSYIQKVTQSVLQLNGKASKHGAVNSVFPSGKIDTSNRHSQNIFVGVTYALAALAIQHGFIKEGLALAEKTWNNIAAIQKDPWNQPDMVSSSTGRYLFGDSYMRNMVLWAIPFALAKHNASVRRMILKLGAPGGVKPTF